MKSPENGTAELKARHPLNCERKESYVLTIAAVACNGQVSERYEGRYEKWARIKLIVVFLVESSKWRWRMSMSTSLCGARRSTPPSWRRERWRRGSWVLLPLITTVPLSSEMFVNIQYPDRIRPSPLTSRESLATLDHCGPSKIKKYWSLHFTWLHFTSKWNIKMVVWLRQRI